MFVMNAVQDGSQNKPKSGGYLSLGVRETKSLREMEVPARIGGTISTLDIRRGDSVTAGQVIGKIDDSRATAQKRVAEQEKTIADRLASSDDEINLAMERLAFSTGKLNRDSISYQKGGVSADTVEESRFRKREASLSLEKAREDKITASYQSELKQRGVQVVQKTIEMHPIICQLDGVVDSVEKQKGEYAQEGDVVAKVIQMSKLGVEIPVRSKEYNPSELKNRKVTVTTTMARGEKVQFTGRIYAIKLEKFVGENYEVLIEIDNRKDSRGEWMLRLKTRVGVHVHLD